MLKLHYSDLLGMYTVHLVVQQIPQQIEVMELA